MLGAALVVGAAAWFTLAALKPDRDVALPVPGSSRGRLLHIRLARGWEAEMKDPRLVRSELRIYGGTGIGLGSVQPGQVPEDRNPDLWLSIGCIRKAGRRSLEDFVRRLPAARRGSSYTVSYHRLPPIRGCQRLARVVVRDGCLLQTVYAGRADEQLVYLLQHYTVAEAGREYPDIWRIMQSAYVE